MIDKARVPATPQLFLGLIVVAVGIIFTLDNLNIIQDDDYLRYWPILLVGFGLVKFAQAASAAGHIAGLFLVTIGSFILLDNLHLMRVKPWEYWPLVLVFIGATLVWQALTRERGPSGEISDTVNALAIMAGIGRTCNSQSFRGGEMTAIMGGCEIDLSQASIEDGRAVINTFAFWGGIEIKIPEDWSVTGKVVPFMGGFEDNTKPPFGGPQKNLVINGFVIMGGIEVKN